MKKLKYLAVALLFTLLATIGLAAPAQAAPPVKPSAPRVVLTLQGDPSFPLQDVAADWSKNTGVTVVVGDCTGQPDCITAVALPPGGDPCGVWNANGCAQDNPTAQTCLVTIDYTMTLDSLSLLYVLKHEVGHCVWAIGPEVPWYGHLDNPRAIMYYAMVGYPQQYNDTTLTSIDRSWSRSLFD